jgi:hypothetical protein
MSNYSGILFLADEGGKYLGLSRKYNARITDDSLFLSELRIPLLAVQRADRLGTGAYVQYVDPSGLPTRICLTTSDIFGIGRKKKITAFLDAVNSQLPRTRKAAGSQQVSAAQKTAPTDTCHDCRCGGGVPLAFGNVVSVIVYSQWSTRQGVFCKKHSTDHGVTALLMTGLLGWWSLRGLFMSPVYTFMNASSLWRHSTLAKPAVLGLVACAVLPPILMIALIVHFSG